MTTTSSSAGGGPPEVRSSRISQKQRTPSDGTDSSSCSAREPWISTNKILNSSLCGRRINSRNPNFDYDETKLLIALWGDPVVQKTLITTHKKHPVIAELARKMRAHGYNRSTEEINTRIKNLKCFYNRIKKDMAAGIINQTTWRHYAEMDEIISRPVFGNNAARLQVQQQQQQQQTNQSESEEQGRNEQEEGGKDEVHELPVKLELMSDDDDEYEPTEIRAEDLLTIDAKFPDDSPAPTPSQRSMRRSRGSAVGGGSKNGKSATNGRAAERKQTEDEDEDDDEDDDDEEEEDDDEGSDFDVENEFNDGLDELLQKAQATKTNTMGKPAGPKPATNESGLVIKTITSGNGTTITATGGTSTSIPTAGKISVVPTNLLMKQPTAASVASSMATPIQIYTQPTMSLGKGVASTVPGTVGASVGGGGAGGVPGAPMKLLLVNTVGKDGKTQQILTPASEATAAGMPKLLPAAMPHTKLPLSVTGQSPIVTIPTMNVPGKVGLEQHKPSATGGRSASGGQSAGFRTLLTQLVTIQRENLALNQERLALEKERLEFEKQFGGSLVGMVRNMSTFFAGMLQQQRKEQHQVKDSGQRPVAPPADSKSPVEQGRKSPDGSKSPPIGEKELEAVPITAAAASATGGASLELSEISSSPSSSASTSRVASPTSTTKVSAGENEKEAKDASGTKRPAEPSSSSPPEDSTVVPAASTGKATSTSDVTLPKKRRMMTRNSAQHNTAQPAGDANHGAADDDPLKTEIISDADEQ